MDLMKCSNVAVFGTRKNPLEFENLAAKDSLPLRDCHSLVKLCCLGEGKPSLHASLSSFDFCKMPEHLNIAMIRLT